MKIGHELNTGGYETILSICSIYINPSRIVHIEIHLLTSGEHEFTLVFSGIRVTQSIIFCSSLLSSLFHVVIVFPVLRLAASDYPFCVLKKSTVMV